MRVRLYESAIASRFVFSRKFVARKLRLFNKIDHKRNLHGLRRKVGYAFRKRKHIACEIQFAAPAGILINSVFIARKFTFG